MTFPQESMMNDNFFAGCVVALLVCMAVAAASAPFLSEDPKAQSARTEVAQSDVVRLPAVVVTGKRITPSDTMAMAPVDRGERP